MKYSNAIHAYPPLLRRNKKPRIIRTAYALIAALLATAALGFVPGMPFGVPCFTACLAVLIGFILAIRVFDYYFSAN